MTKNILTDIAVSVRKRVEQRKSRLHSGELKKLFPLSRRPLGLDSSFLPGSINIIAEVKRKSPSEGEFKADFDCLRIAGGYVKNGARALSVLTEEDHFGGSLENLNLIRKNFPTTPLLMKDFIIDEYQIYEGALAGADSILLIVALLERAELLNFFKLAQGLGLACLVEVHNEEELNAAVHIQAPLIGVNNRNLKTLEISLDTARQLAPLAPKSATLICESGIKNREQIEEMKTLGYAGFLIGSTLMRSSSPGEALAGLVKVSP